MVSVDTVLPGVPATHLATAAELALFRYTEAVAVLVAKEPVPLPLENWNPGDGDVTAVAPVNFTTDDPPLLFQVTLKVYLVGLPPVASSDEQLLPFLPSERVAVTLLVAVTAGPELVLQPPIWTPLIETWSVFDVAVPATSGGL